MISVDTNILVCLLTNDDPEQVAAAKALFDSDEIWVAKTVLLETAWVLQYRYGLDDADAATALTTLLGLDNVHAEDEPSIVDALALVKRGLDIAGAIHLASRADESEFVSFDKRFVERARRAGVTWISCLPDSD